MANTSLRSALLSNLQTILHKDETFDLENKDKVRIKNTKTEAKIDFVVNRKMANICYTYIFDFTVLLVLFSFSIKQNIEYNIFVQGENTMAWHKFCLENS